ncbi:MAG: LysR family transcriptional regulator [Desulfobacterium sp.]
MIPPKINPYQLTTFYFVANEGTISAAAEKLCVTQPAVSMQIKSLEKYYGIKLINVKKKKVCLTKTGEKLFKYAESFYHSAIRAEIFLQDCSNNNLRIGVASPLAQHIILLIDKFSKMYPKVKISLKEGTDQEIISAILDFRCNLGFTGTVDPLINGLTVVPVTAKKKLVLITCPENPLVNKKKVTLQDLEGCSLIVHREGMTGRKIILDLFYKYKIDPIVIAEIDNIEGMKNLIKQGSGIALMFYPNVEREICHETLKVISLTDERLKIGIDAIFQTDLALSKSSKVFLELASNHLLKREQSVIRVTEAK